MKSLISINPSPQRIGAASITALLLTFPAGAQDDPATAPAEEANTLPALVVEANSDTAVITETVTAEEISLTQAVDLAGMFQNTPEVRVGGGSPAAQKLYVRGFEDKQLNITIDGATQAGYLTHHQTQLMIQPEFLKSAEVSAGAGAATNGPGGLGGTIRFTHKGAEDFLNPGQNFGVWLKSGYLSQGDGIQESFAIYGNLSESWSLVGGFDYLDVGDYTDGHGDKVSLTGHQQIGGYLKLDGDISLDQQISFTYERMHDEGTFWHRPNFAGAFPHPVAPNAPVFNRTDRDTFTINYEYNPIQEWLDIEGTAYYNNYRIDRKKQYEMGVESLGFDLRNTAVIEDHAITYGADYRHDETSFTGKGSVTGFAGTLVYNTTPDEPLDVFGLFAQDNWQIAEPLLLSYGLRFDYYDFEDYTGQNFDDTHFSPNAMISYQVIDPLNVYVRYAQAFQGVTALDSITRSEGGTVNDPDAEGQTAQNIDLGVRYDSGNWFANGSVFQQTIDDVLATPAGVRTNSGKLESWGYTLEGGYHNGPFAASLAVVQSFPELNGEELNDNDLGLGTATGRAWNATLDYTFEQARLNLGWSAQFVESYDDTPAGIPGKDSYFVNNLYAQWRPLENHDLYLNLAVTNIFDEYYVDQATSGYNTQLARVAGLPAQGRGITISANYKF